MNEDTAKNTEVSKAPKHDDSLRDDIEALLRLLPGNSVIGGKVRLVAGGLLDRLDELDAAVQELYRDRI